MRWVPQKDVNEVIDRLISDHGWTFETRKKHFIIRHPLDPGRRRTIHLGGGRVCPEALKNLRAELRRVVKEGSRCTNQEMKDG